MRAETEGPAPIAEMQAALAEIAQELRRIDQRLGTLLAALPPSADYSDPMLDWEAPPTMEAELFTALECIRNESLRQLIDLVEQESQVTLDMIEAEWRQRQAKKGPSREAR